MSELSHAAPPSQTGVYQAFRWWGVGTMACSLPICGASLSSVPVVGCRNHAGDVAALDVESIKRSGGGVSELACTGPARSSRVYQAFRWWGVGTKAMPATLGKLSLSSVPVVGCRNLSACRSGWHFESIKRSGGGVSEHSGRGSPLTI